MRVAVTGAGPTAFRWTDGRAGAWRSNFSPAAHRRRSRVDASGLNGDIHASAEYRAHLIKVIAKRAVAAAA